MGKLFGKLSNWIVSAVAVATLAYALNTYTFSRTTNGVNIKGPKSSTTVTYNAGRSEIKNTYNLDGSNIETTLGHDNSGFFGSLDADGDGISGTYGNGKGRVESSIGDFLGGVDIDYDSSRSSTFNQWISGFDWLYNDNGNLRGYNFRRI